MTRANSKLEQAALTAEIVGGIAVVVSVIYLAVQISDNNRLLRSQAHYNALEVLQRPIEAILESDSLSNALYHCDRMPSDVEESVWPRCSNYYFMQANGWEYTYYQNLDEAIPSELWVGVDGFMKNQAETNPGWVRFWSDASLAFGEPFYSHIAESIEKNPAFVEED